MKDKETGEWIERTAPHVRFKFRMEGYQYPHYSRWMRASMSEKSNLYSKHLTYLCPTLEPDAEVDLDKLVGLKVKTMWEHDGDFQRIVQIRGLNPTLSLLPDDGSTKATTSTASEESADVSF